MMVDNNSYHPEFEVFQAKNTVLFGPPASGKTSLVKELSVELPNAHYISLGEISRAINPESELGQRIAGLHLLACPWPADLVVDMVLPAIRERITAQPGFILDGVPRKMDEYRVLRNSFLGLGIGIDVVLELEAPDTVVLERLYRDSVNRSGRAEADEHYSKRILMYRQQTQTVIDLMTREFGAQHIRIDTTQGDPKCLIADLTQKFLTS